MTLYEINENFEGTWDEAMYLGEYHTVRELTDKEADEMKWNGCENELQFII